MHDFGVNIAEVTRADAGRVQGYGAASVWKQRSERWFVNAPRRLHLRALQLLTYDAGSVSANLLFREEMLRHIVITILYLLYPVFVIRVAYDGTWLYALELKVRERESDSSRVDCPLHPSPHEAR